MSDSEIWLLAVVCATGCVFFVESVASVTTPEDDDEF
jgi:hypothetical protein